MKGNQDEYCVNFYVPIELDGKVIEALGHANNRCGFTREIGYFHTYVGVTELERV